MCAPKQATQPIPRFPILPILPIPTLQIPTMLQIPILQRQRVTLLRLCRRRASLVRRRMMTWQCRVRRTRRKRRAMPQPSQVVDRNCHLVKRFAELFVFDFSLSIFIDVFLFSNNDCRVFEKFRLQSKRFQARRMVKCLIVKHC